MNLSKSFSTVCALLGLTLGLISSAANATDYPLYCRGGGGEITVTDNINSQAGQTLYNIHFGSGTRAYAGISTIQPGECQWADRAFRSGESTFMTFTIYNDHHFAYVTWDDYGVIYSITTPWVFDLTNASNIIKFMVHLNTSSNVRDPTSGTQIIDSAAVQ